MRAMFVIPDFERIKLLLHGWQAEREQGFAEAFGFHGSDEPLDYSDAAMLANCSETWAD